MDMINDPMTVLVILVVIGLLLSNLEDRSTRRHSSSPGGMRK